MRLPCLELSVVNERCANRLAIVCTHPVQYLSPVFAQLAKCDDLDVKVYYGWKGGTQTTLDHGFGQQFAWDVPLLEGYNFQFETNVAKDPGGHHFRGVDLPSLINNIVSWRADGVFIYGWCYKSHLRAMRFFKGRVPVFFRGDSTLLDEVGGWKTLLRRIVLKRVYRNVDVAFSVGTNNREYFLKHGLADSQIVHAPHAIDNMRFHKSAVSVTNSLRRELGIPENNIVFAFCGKLEHKKSPDELLASFLRIGSADAHLIIAGSGPMESSLRSLANERVHFLGFQNQTQMPRVYEAADLVVLPSRGPGETWGLALNEAMACGRAVLASDRVGAAIDLIQLGKNGWIVPACDGHALEASLRQAVALGRHGLTEYGKASKDIIDRWSIPIQVEAIARTVKLVMATRDTAIA